MTPVLETFGLSVQYGGLHAVDGVDLVVEPGRLVGLIGPNGAGKTTFIDAITGFVSSRGRVVVGGRDISNDSPDSRARAGLGRTWQSLELFDDLTVRENLEVAADAGGARNVVADLFRPRRPRTRHAVEDAIERLGLAAFADRLPIELSQGQRKLVGVARALAGSPRVVCLDEPAGGLDSGESEELGHRLRETVDSGVAVLLVDHDMGLVLAVCDEVYVLEFGRVIARGTPAAIRDDPQVIAAYLGQRSQGARP
jgi:branched-chain amino acid transport system ATP-binding protein